MEMETLKYFLNDKKEDTEAPYIMPYNPGNIAFGSIDPIAANNIVSKKSLRRVQKTTMQTIADALRMTYGPLGSNSWLITGNDKQSLKNEFSKDGRTVLKKILFTDPIEMAIQTEIEEIALYTDKEVGDGTTSATLISNAIFQRFYEYEDKCNMSPYNIIRGFKEVISRIQERILERINKLKRIKDKDEVKEIIKNSYLMCQN